MGHLTLTTPILRWFVQRSVGLDRAYLCTKIWRLY